MGGQVLPESTSAPIHAVGAKTPNQTTAPRRDSNNLFRAKLADKRPDCRSCVPVTPPRAFELSLLPGPAAALACRRILSQTIFRHQGGGFRLRFSCRP